MIGAVPFALLPRCHRFRCSAVAAPSPLQITISVLLLPTLPLLRLSCAICRNHCCYPAVAAQIPSSSYCQHYGYHTLMRVQPKPQGRCQSLQGCSPSCNHCCCPLPQRHCGPIAAINTTNSTPAAHRQNTPAGNTLANHTVTCKHTSSTPAEHQQKSSRKPASTPAAH